MLFEKTVQFLPNKKTSTFSPDEIADALQKAKPFHIVQTWDGKDYNTDVADILKFVSGKTLYWTQFDLNRLKVAVKTWLDNPVF